MGNLGRNHTGRIEKELGEELRLWGIPRQGGTYALLFKLASGQLIQVGKLGVTCFPAGYYLYIGSALRGIKGRVGRHIRPETRPHWHIDYLAQYAQPQAVIWKEGRERLECQWAQQARMLPGCQVPAWGFGSSDCYCVSHLVWLPSQAAAHSFASTVEASGTQALAPGWKDSLRTASG